MKHLFPMTPDARTGEVEHRVIMWAAAENLNNVKRMWRHGRAHFRARGCGRRRKYVDPKTGQRSADYGKRGELGVNLEWVFFDTNRYPSRGVGFSFKWGTNGSETTPDISVSMGPIGAVYLNFECLVPYRWLERTYVNKQGERVPDWESRVIDFRLTLKSVHWEIWNKAHTWDSQSPKWMIGSVDFARVILGKTVHSDVVIKEGVCMIPMPERTYPATFKVHKWIYTYQRPIGRLRDFVLGPRTGYTCEVEPGKPIPIPGKGENSWDCGDDAMYGMSCSGQDPLVVVGNIVSSALRTRREHGGQHMSVPAEDAPSA